MVAYVIGTAIALLVLALLILGTSWSGQPTADRTWVDGVSLRQWALFLAALAGVAMAVGHRVATGRDRVLALLPTLAWLGIALWGPLGPIPLVIYLVPTGLVWVGALAAGARLRSKLARTMKS